MVYAIFPLAHFEQLFASHKLHSLDSVAFRDGQQGLIVRYPAVSKRSEVGSRVFSEEYLAAVRMSPESGAYQSGDSGVDGVQRLHFYRRNAAYGFYLNVGLAQEEVLKPWQKEFGNTLILLTLFALLTALLARQGRAAWNVQQAGMEGLRQSETRFRSLIANMTEGVALNEMILDKDGQPVNYRILDVNPAYQTQTGLAPEDVLGKLGTEAYGVDKPPYLSIYARVVKTGEPEEFESYVAAMQKHFRVLAYSPLPGQVAVVFENISGRKKVEQKLRLMAGVFSNMNESILITDAENRIIAANFAFSRLTGYLEAEVIGKNPKVLSAGRTEPGVFTEMWAALQSEGHWEGELWDRRKSGEIYPKWLSISVMRDQEGKICNYIGSFVDIAERKASEEKVRYLAHHDALTGLPNRYSLHERLVQAVGTARRNGRQLAVFMIDLDRFKVINDTLGHTVGDQLLIEVAKRLSGSVRETDIVARLGGDEFVVVLPTIDTPADAAHVAEKIIAAMAQVFLLEGSELRTSPSIGISLYPEDAIDIADLLKNADIAMYHAKELGRNNFQFFTETMQIAANNRLAVEADLRTAIEQGQFILHYQPQLDLRNGRLIGVEALVRWEHPLRGLISPLDFIAVAEETGLIVQLGDWVLVEACRQLARWRANGLTAVVMSINLSACQFLDPDLPKRLDAVLAENGLDASSLNLEITESMSMASPETTASLIQSLTGMGTSLAIDDFGTGYSSLAYLKLFPIKTLKIDRSFVKDIETDPNDAEICDVTVLLAHKLGLDVVAEGVETEAQLRYLRSIGCEKIQGYLISRPLPADQAEAFLLANPRMDGLGTVDLWPAA